MTTTTVDADVSAAPRRADEWTLASAEIVDVSPERRALARLSGEVLGSAGTPYDDPEQHVARAKALAPSLPPTVLRALGRVAARPAGSALLLRGLPLDRELCPTPGTVLGQQRPPGKSSFVSESLLSLIAGGLGNAVGYLQEQDGALWQQVVARREMAAAQASAGYAVDLEYHTETCFHPFLPDWLVLLCLRGDRDGLARTYYASAVDVVSYLSPLEVGVLREPAFVTGVDVSFGGGDMPGLMPVIEGHGPDVRIRYDADLMRGTSNRGVRALRELGLVARARRHEVVLEPGDCFVLDNSAVVHGRSAYSPRFDGLDRWLQRAFVRECLPPAEHLLNGRSIITGPLPAGRRPLTG